MVACWVGSTIPRVKLGQHMRTTLHAAVVSHHQAGLIVTSRTACAGRIITVTIRPPRKRPGRKIRSLIVLTLCRKAAAWHGANRYSVRWCRSECHSVQLGGGAIIRAPITPKLLWPQKVATQKRFDHVTLRPRSGLFVCPPKIVTLRDLKFRS